MATAWLRLQSQPPSSPYQFHVQITDTLLFFLLFLFLFTAQKEFRRNAVKASCFHAALLVSYSHPRGSESFHQRHGKHAGSRRHLRQTQVRVVNACLCLIVSTPSPENTSGLHHTNDLNLPRPLIDLEWCSAHTDCNYLSFLTRLTCNLGHPADIMKPEANNILSKKHCLSSRCSRRAAYLK